MRGTDKTHWVLEQARMLGFDLCGVASVEDYVAGLAQMSEWLERGYAGEMNYLRDPRRLDPRRVLDPSVSLGTGGGRGSASLATGSIIVCALNYNTPLPYSTEVPASDSPAGWISRYAWGDDYHEVLGEKLKALVTAMREEFAEPFEARAYVDTGPVVERVAAKSAGLGWLAKNTCLINERLGSWLFLGAVLTTLDLAPTLGLAEAPPPDLCGNCRLCIDACPTGAIVEPYVLDARRCISYLTIELRGPIPEEFRPAIGRHVFGCDVCQDVCPWNRKAPVTSTAAFQPRQIPSSVGALLVYPVRSPDSGGVHRTPETGERSRRAAPSGKTRNPKLETREAETGEPGSPAIHSSLATCHSLLTPELEWLASLTEKEFREGFRSSAVKRTKWRGLVRNACVALGNALAQGHAAASLYPQPRARITSLLQRLAASDDAVIAEHAQWALERLRSAKN